MHKTGIYWFTNDLRLSDNPGLEQAAGEMDSLLFIYILEPHLLKSTSYQSSRLGAHRKQFLLESLEDLRLSLQHYGLQLLVINDSISNAFQILSSSLIIDGVYRSEHVAHNEKHDWRTLKQTYPDIRFKETPTHRLFLREELPFLEGNLPASFSKFRRLVEPLNIENLKSRINLPYRIAEIKPAVYSDQLKPYLVSSPLIFRSNPGQTTAADKKIRGGETEAQIHMQNYFSSTAPQSYKEQRNALDDWSSSTKLSPWLAHGNLSVHRIIAALGQHESEHGSNDSTYWIRFELLWREYFQWYALEHGAKLFAFSGVKDQSPLNCFYPERFRRWCDGTTPYPIVNACMRQLKTTGYMSNRGRQIVASCFVNELQLDWRFGAAYFEQQLIDYDAGSNWGNWQYLAGVGADPRGLRHFDLEKQTKIYDPNHRFIEKWKGNEFDGSLDSNDAADWPIR